MSTFRDLLRLRSSERDLQRLRLDGVEEMKECVFQSSFLWINYWLRQFGGSDTNKSIDAEQIGRPSEVDQSVALMGIAPR